MHIPFRFLSAFTAFALLTGSVAARAQEAPPPPVARTPPPPSSARGPNGEYVAPLAQQTQRTYIPQSIALSGPREISTWGEGEPVPDGYHVRTRLRKGPVIAGAVTFGALYLFSALAAAGSADANPRATNPSASLWVPAIGPFLQMAHADSQTGGVMLAIDGLGQSLGLALLIYGLTTPKSVLVRDDLSKMRITPMRMGKDGYGLGVTGHF